MGSWYKIDNEHEIDSPALLVYPDRIRRNIAVAIAMIDDINRLRPHVKTHKTPEIVEMQLEAGITKFKCATIAEAEMLGSCGAPDVLLAYPLYGPKIDRFIRVLERFPHTRFAAVADHRDAAVALDTAARINGVRIDLFIDLDIGMGRTGIKPDEQALSLYRYCNTLGGLSIQGFHAYDGHVRTIDLAARTEICERNFEPISRLIARIEDEMGSRPRIVIGGSPSYPIYARYPDVECSPGTFLLWDKGYGDSLPEQDFLPAAVLLTRVVSAPGANYRCVDLGYKAIASENPLDQRVFFLSDPDLTPVTHSEEHLLLECNGDSDPRLGDVVYALPIHICPTVALYETLSVVQDRRAAGTWRVLARQR